ncbi:MAG: T9SS type A sorting domain-containing protein [Bacteroidota bacterium]
MKKYQFLWILIILMYWSGYSQQVAEDYENIVEKANDYIYSPQQNNKESRALFKEIKLNAQEGDAEAMCMLGILYKDGVGVRQNYDKAKSAFKKAYDLGSSSAAYCLGYMFLKGLGTIPQDYKKAAKWFKKSDNAMSNHWLAKMHFFGLGREQNIKKAISILEDNTSFNSEVFLSQINEDRDFSKSTIEIDGKISTSLNGLLSLETELIPDQIIGKWEGKWIELDWSGTKVMRQMPIDFEIKPTQSIVDEVDTHIVVNDSVSTGRAEWNEGQLRFLNSTLAVKKEYTDYPAFTHLRYELEKIDFKKFDENGTSFLLGTLKSHLPVWKEPAPPGFILLTLVEEKYNDEILAAFESQANDFIKIYPNPFFEYFLLNYELLEPANVTISLNDYYNSRPIKVLYQGRQKMGEHTMEFTDLPSNQGLYVVTLSVNGQVHRKIVINQ